MQKKTYLLISLDDDIFVSKTFVHVFDDFVIILVDRGLKGILKVVNLELITDVIGDGQQLIDLFHEGLQ